jgi:hypothetical protein
MSPISTSYHIVSHPQAGDLASMAPLRDFRNGKPDDDLHRLREVSTEPKFSEDILSFAAEALPIVQKYLQVRKLEKPSHVFSARWFAKVANKLANDVLNSNCTPKKKTEFFSLLRNDVDRLAKITKDPQLVELVRQPIEEPVLSDPHERTLSEQSIQSETVRLGKIDFAQPNVDKIFEHLYKLIDGKKDEEAQDGSRKWYGDNRKSVAEWFWDKKRGIDSSAPDDSAIKNGSDLKRLFQKDSVTSIRVCTLLD